MKSRLIEIPEVLFILGLTSSPGDRDGYLRNRKTFDRKFRKAPNFPQPVHSPAHRLAYRERGIYAYIEQLPNETAGCVS